MHYLLIILFFILPAHAIEHNLYGAAAVNYNSNHANGLPDRYKLRHKQNLSLSIGALDIIPMGSKFAARLGIFAENKQVSVKQNDPSSFWFDDDFTSIAWYLNPVINLLYHASESMSFHAGLSPKILVAKSCDNDTIFPMGCGSFASPKVFVNYANAGLSFNLIKQLDLSLNYQKALSDNYKNVRIDSLQVMLIHPI